MDYAGALLEALFRIVLPLLVVALIVVPAVWYQRRQREQRLSWYRLHEARPLGAAPFSGAWLSPQDRSDFWFNGVGGTPEVGRTNEAYELTSNGRTAVSFMEHVRHGKSSTIYHDVTVPTRWQGSLFTNRGQLICVPERPLCAQVAHDWTTRGALRAVIVHQGHVVLRGNRFEDVPANAELALWLAGELDRLADALALPAPQAGPAWPTLQEPQPLLRENR